VRRNRRKISKTRLQKIKRRIGIWFFSAFLIAVVLTRLTGSSVHQLSAYHPTPVTLVPPEILDNKIALQASLSAVPVDTPIPTPQPRPAGFCINVPVLYYHHIQPVSDILSKKQQSVSINSDVFDAQMSYLSSRGYNAITVKQLVDALYSHSQLPAKSVAITLDDGYRDSYTYAFPILKKYGLVASYMIPTGLLEGPDYLTWNQITELKNSGSIYLVDHTWSHFAVGTTHVVDKINFEITSARSQLQDKTGQTIDIFAYPYGSFNDTSISLLKQNGFRAAFSTLGGSLQCETQMYTLHRIHVGSAPLSAYGL
jgi:peptidoglycan/xylan/chitin deacetylase (PgdA/CDA1 family)